jgi:hypothetical protein
MSDHLADLLAEQYHLVSASAVRARVLRVAETYAGPVRAVPMTNRGDA